jgi:hypothetical protein
LAIGSHLRRKIANSIDPIFACKLQQLREIAIAIDDAFQL